MDINNIFGLFFNINGNIDIYGYFSNSTEYENDSENPSLNSYDKYFILTKSNNEFNYLNLNISINLGYTSNLKIMK